MAPPGESAGAGGSFGEGVVTPRPGLEYVGVGPRAVAVIIDTAMLFALGYVIALLSGETTASGYEIEGLPALVAIFAWFAYYIGTEAAFGATLGKRLVGIQVVSEDGSPLLVPSAVMRNVLRIVDGLFIYLVAAILVWRSPRRQRLGDRVAHTVVIRSAHVGRRHSR